MTDTAASAIGNVGSALQQMRELVVQAGDATLSASDRQTIQTQIGQLGQQLDQVVGQTQFYGQNLLDGSFSVQTQTGSGEASTIAIGNMSSSALGVGSLDVTTADGATNALNAIDTALGTVAQQQSQLGASSTGFSAAQNNDIVAANSATAANSQISDTDYATASTSLAQNKVKLQASLKALAMYNEIQKQQVTKLLP